MKTYLTKRSEAISLLERYSEFLESQGYLDTDWKVEPPYAIDEFLKVFSLPSEDSKEGHENEKKAFTDKLKIRAAEYQEKGAGSKHDFTAGGLFAYRELKDGHAKGIPTDQEIENEANERFPDLAVDFYGYMPERRVGFMICAKWMRDRLQENSRESRQEPSEGKIS